MGYVWILINTLDSKDEIKDILNTEIIESQCNRIQRNILRYFFERFTGIISRLINCLNGFTDLVKVNISSNQQIGNIIIIIRK